MPLVVLHVLKYVEHYICIGANDKLIDISWCPNLTRLCFEHAVETSCESWCDCIVHVRGHVNGHQAHLSCHFGDVHFGVSHISHCGKILDDDCFCEQSHNEIDQAMMLIPPFQ